MERWAEQRISSFLSCCFQSSPVSMATSYRRQGDSSERKGTRLLKEDGQPVYVCEKRVSVHLISTLRTLIIALKFSWWGVGGGLDLVRDLPNVNNLFV